MIYVGVLDFMFSTFSLPDKGYISQLENTVNPILFDPSARNFMMNSGAFNIGP